MLNSNNFDFNLMSDLAIAQQVGNFVKNTRIQQNLTQDQIAKKTGLNRSTISEIENGRQSSFVSIIQILRALGQLDLLDVFSVKTLVSPLEIAKLEAKKRKRASKNKITETDFIPEW